MKKIKLFLISQCFGLFFSSVYAVDYSQNEKTPKHQYDPTLSGRSPFDIALSETGEEEKKFQKEEQAPFKDSIKLNYDYKNLNHASNYNIGKCFDYFGSYYRIDPWLLFAIAKTESSFNPQAVNRNSNGTEDYGIMQINSIWLKQLNKMGIEKNDLFVPCKSVMIGAWILAQNFNRFGYNIDGLGAYNSPSNIKIRRAYAQKVLNNYQKIQQDIKNKKLK